MPARVAEVYQVISVLTEETFEVTQLCEVLGVSRSSHCHWKNLEPNLYQRQDQELEPMVKDIFQQHRRRYGAGRIARDIREEGVSLFHVGVCA